MNLSATSRERQISKRVSEETNGSGTTAPFFSTTNRNSKPRLKSLYHKYFNVN
jgi:hypothetical protein